MRRLVAARAASAVLSVTTLSQPPNAATACITAQGATLVVGGAKCSEAWLYRERAEEEEDGGSTRSTKTKKNRQAELTVRC